MLENIIILLAYIGGISALFCLMGLIEWVANFNSRLNKRLRVERMIQKSRARRRIKQKIIRRCKI